MSEFAERLATFKADVRQQTQRIRARLERAREGPYRRRAARRLATGGWSPSRGGDDAAPSTASSLHAGLEGLLSRPRTVREATERLQTRRSLIRRQQTRRAI